jgi:hypothetical protein
MIAWSDGTAKVDATLIAATQAQQRLRRPDWRRERDLNPRGA